ncbi:GNAT family N-acetyltransferase [Caldibacillus thermolactis]|jgi:RimJ/RimL family protein N-acetyltransferase|uniref:GNAT family N-acetyltransferase n=1 Tax=Pallidibacillus thermolactis TaxID=251051 RepID=A0ABT2WJJ5_9BACI|nr:GNAT family protein [Pallidibacillus thermolactis]MCU9595745.1 GNAT family N-acetyltransferase [Pallidibacillus thermolactis]MCU9602005.1 GNAT family N-acetyltransferase [Pallidibacillus thermolactis subsp. kokeshiiformis]MED1673598.1 GNAT family protein [Pallidibacillus thermolactis subsp. kokeshiiformis]
MYLKKRDLNDCSVLYPLITHPEVFPFVREKPNSYEEYLFLTKKVMENEEKGVLISRTILDEWETPIGVITLYDINNHTGFLGTWLGKPYHGKGYNRIAKELFFQELFFEKDFESIFLRVRFENIRSQKAVEKIPYITKANETRPFIFEKINTNPNHYLYHLYEISKDAFTLYYKVQLQAEGNRQQLKA